MKEIEKRVIDDPQNNIRTREQAIRAAKRMRNGAKSKQERKQIDKLLDRLNAEIRYIKEKGETPTKDVAAIMARLNEWEQKIKNW